MNKDKVRTTNFFRLMIKRRGHTRQRHRLALVVEGLAQLGSQPSAELGESLKKAL